MQPVSVKDKWHGVTAHTGSWPIYRSRNHGSPKTSRAPLLCSFHSPSGCHVLRTSLMLLLACYVVLVMRETNTVWYGKTQQGSYLCKQNRSRWDLGIWGKQSPYSTHSWGCGFSVLHIGTLQRSGRLFKCSDCAIEKISGKETETALQRPSVGLTGSSTERMSANTWSHATPTRHSGFINTFHCYYSWGNWQPAAPDAHISPTWYLQGFLELLLHAMNKASFCYTA